MAPSSLKLGSSNLFWRGCGSEGLKSFRFYGLPPTLNLAPPYNRLGGGVGLSIVCAHIVY